MKKILLSFFAVLMTVGAWAQEPTTHPDGVYKIFWQWNQRGYLTYHAEDYPNEPKLSGVELAGCKNLHYAIDEEGISTSWYLYTSPKTAKTYLFEATTGKFVTLNTEETASGGYVCSLTDKPTLSSQLTLSKTTNTEGFMLSYTHNNKQYNFCSGCGTEKAGHPVRFVTDGQTDGGIPFVFVSEGASITDAVKNAAIAKITTFETVVTLSYTITDNAGNVYEGSFEAGPETDPTFTGVAGYTLSDKNWNGNKLTATINFPFPVSKEGGNTNATMISNFGASRNKLFADETSVKAILDEEITVSNLSTHLWAIYPEFTEGAFVFTVMNTATGKYIYSESNANSHDEGVVVLSEEASKMTVEGSNRFKLPTGKYLSLNSSTQTQAQYLGTWGAHNGCNLAFPSYAVVSLNEAGYASTYLPFNAALSEGLEAYAVTATSATKATLTALQGIKANQGAILKGAASTEYVLAAGNVSSDWSGNLLKGSTADTEVTGEGYVLSTVNSVTGFYAAKLTDGKFKNNAGKAYLPKPAEASARFISLDFGTETAIESVESVENNAVVYDLAGRRVQGAQKGVYVVNGKVVIK